MAHLKAFPSGPIPIISRALLKNSVLRGIPQVFPTGCQKLWFEFAAKGRIACHERCVSLDFIRNGRRGRFLERKAWVFLSTSSGEVGCVGESEDRNRGVGSGQIEYLVSEFGWRVRRMAEVGDEIRRVAYVQAEAFHVPVALFNDLFFEFFKAEVLSDLSYRLRNSAPSRYACLVAEPMDASNLLSTSLQEIVGVVDVTVQRDKDVLRHLDGVEEYLYVSGIAVLKNFRRQKVASALLKACDALSFLWGFNCLALRAYENDLGARKLYSNAGYRVVSGDPRWMTTWIGRKRRVLMIKQSSFGDSCQGLEIRSAKA